MKAIVKITVVLGCSLAATSSYAGGQVNSKSQSDGGVQEAIRFEKAKDAADTRQAQIEAARTHQGATNRAVAPANERSREGNVRDPGVQAAIQFERNKDAADARQAGIAAGQSSGTARVGSSDRSIGKHQ